jgi:hypothetical protein
MQSEAQQVEQAFADSCDPSARYERGLWVVSYYGLKFRLTRKAAPGSRDQEMDLSVSFTTLGEAQAAADARNAGGAL